MRPSCDSCILCRIFFGLLLWLQRIGQPEYTFFSPLTAPERPTIFFWLLNILLGFPRFPRLDRSVGGLWYPDLVWRDTCHWLAGLWWLSKLVHTSTFVRLASIRYRCRPFHTIMHFWFFFTSHSPSGCRLTTPDSHTCWSCRLDFSGFGSRSCPYCELFWRSSYSNNHFDISSTTPYYLSSYRKTICTVVIAIWRLITGDWLLALWFRST